ncbi:hypothetical protein BC938DRAFT_476314 [Jimgerdemannia flammicorona]|uniref:Uncharacterized protein n=1 Tax=Jimgerdemannia flammicorona TaxID=994334 RepID=A0A433PIA8_9FUNG|nr:hypothetical protein BC938DRAFT_476314 [Jimgerdemannia flammicorona]
MAIKTNLTRWQLKLRRMKRAKAGWMNEDRHYLPCSQHAHPRWHGRLSHRVPEIAEPDQCAPASLSARYVHSRERRTSNENGM